MPKAAMPDHPDPARVSMPNPLATLQTATARLRLGRRIDMEASVVVTPAGLLAIGGLVAAILLSVPPIVRAARRARADDERGGVARIEYQDRR